MNTTERTWDDFSHAERAAEHRADVVVLRQQRRSDHSAIDPDILAEAENRAAEAEEALAVEVAETIGPGKNR